MLVLHPLLALACCAIPGKSAVQLWLRSNSTPDDPWTSTPTGQVGGFGSLCCARTLMSLFCVRPLSDVIQLCESYDVTLLCDAIH